MMKILFLSQGRQIEDQIDFDVSLRNAHSKGESVDLLNIPYVSYVEKKGRDAFYSEVVRANSEFQPDMIFFQFFHSANPGNPQECIRALHAARNRPLVFGSIGDAFDTGILKCLGRPIPDSTINLAVAADAFFSTSMGGVVDELVMHGARNVVFLPHAFLPEHFALPDPGEEPLKTHDVVMIGSKCKVLTRRIVTGFTRGFVRNGIVNSLEARFGSRFALYGKGWECASAKGPCKFSDQIDIFRSAKVAVDVPSQVEDTYYLSDRPFFIAGSGTPLVMKYVTGVDKIFRENENAFFAREISEIPWICERILQMPAEQLVYNRRRTIEIIAERHLLSHRIDTILSVYEALKDVRSGTKTLSDSLSHLRLWHFLPETEVKAEYRRSVRNWVG